MLNKLKHYIQDKFAPKIQKLYNYFYFKQLRKELTNNDFSLFAPNCYAGIIYHRLGLQFKSPTINLFFPYKKQYLKFVSNIQHYLSKELVFVKDNIWNCPTAMLDDVEIVFNHSKTEEEAAKHWNKRKERVNYDNIFIIFDDIADAEYSDLVEFLKIPCKGKIILTAKDYPEFKQSVQIKKYKKEQKLKSYLFDINIWTGKNPVDRDFNFVKWLNNGN